MFFKKLFGFFQKILPLHILKSLWDPVWALPNAITAFRPLSTIPIILLYKHGYYWPAAIWYALGMFSDTFDGLAARRIERHTGKKITTFGKLFDPLADKLFTIPLLIFCDTWMIDTKLIVILGLVELELMVVAIINRVFRRGWQVAATWFGKTKMTMECILLALVFIMPLSHFTFTIPKGIVDLWLGVTLVLAFMSLWFHLRKDTTGK